MVVKETRILPHNKIERESVCGQMRSSNWQLVKHHRLYAGLEPRVRKRLTQTSLIEVVPKGTVLFQQGDFPQFLHIILSGQVRLKAEDRRRRETVLDVLNAGDILDVPMFFLSIPYVYSAVTMVPSRIMIMPCLACHRVLQEEPSWANALIDSLSRGLCELGKQAIELKLSNVDERTASYLLRRVDVQNGEPSVTLSEGHAIVAQRLGMSPESFSRALRRLRGRGVEVRGKHIRISDLDRLRDYCGVDRARPVSSSAPP
jgi:CRP/FNR family transcriptional activator FtrB